MTGRAFLAVLRRDLFVTGRELPSFLAQTLVQPFFFLLVFVVVLGRGGFVSPEYGQIMLPGLRRHMGHRKRNCGAICATIRCDAWVVRWPSSNWSGICWPAHTRHVPPGQMASSIEI